MKRQTMQSKRILRCTLFIVCQFLLLSGCSKYQIPEYDNMIVGKWEWIETINAWTGFKYTPETEGFTKTTVYKNDYTAEYLKVDGPTSIYKRIE